MAGVKRVIVTGPAGFVGANLVRRLAQDGNDVHLFIHPKSETWRLEGLDARTVPYLVDLENRDQVTEAVRRARPNWIFHAAAHGAYPYQTDLRRMIATNIVGTANLLEAAIESGFEAFVHTGSSSEYGVKDHAPAPDELPEPNSYYAVTKASATLYCRYMARQFELPIRVLRLYSVYGPWEEPTRLMPRVIVEGLKGNWPPMANPATARDYVYTDDVVDAFVAAATVEGQEPGAVYNIGTGFQTSLREVARVARQELGIDNNPEWGSMPDRVWDTAVWVADPSSALKGLGWEARHDLATGFPRFARWLREHPHLLELYDRACR